MTSSPSELSEAYSDRYAAISRRLLRQAQEELDDGDFIQASEKAWGSAAHAIKAIAEKWGWCHQGHYRLDAVVKFVSYEMGRVDLINLYLHPSVMHSNYYEHELEPDDIQTAINATGVFVGEMEKIRTGPIPGLPPQEELTQPQARRLRMLTTEPRDYKPKPDNPSLLPPVETGGP